MKLIIICSFVFIFNGCKGFDDYFSFDFDTVNSVDIIPLKNTHPPFSEAVRIHDIEDIQNILKKLTSVTEYNSFSSKLNHNTFILKINRIDDSISYPIYYNETLDRTSIELFSNGINGYKIGHYECKGLYELLRSIIREG